MASKEGPAYTTKMQRAARRAEMRFALVCARVANGAPPELKLINAVIDELEAAERADKDAP